MIGSDMVMTAHTFPYKYQTEHFPLLKQVSLSILGKVILDMLSYAEKNGAISALTNSAGSIMTFSDSRFSLKSGQPSIVVGFLRQSILED